MISSIALNDWLAKVPAADQQSSTFFGRTVDSDQS
jgi:hypothetical protein